jgi:hypothetical protein
MEVLDGLCTKTIDGITLITVHLVVSIDGWVGYVLWVFGN